MLGTRQELEATYKQLNSVSPCFCLAKWTQVTIHLQNGTTHSCHHPTPHKIPLDELARTPAALQNTQHLLEQKAKMLRGERPSECSYCWRIEDSGPGVYSDRILKSTLARSQMQANKISLDPLNVNHKPSYVEINIGDKCNFKCSYCGPVVSTRWMSEVKTFGSYPTSGRHPVLNPETMPIPEDQANPYIEAFWRWWPELYPQLHTFRITGGEPLLNRNLFRILDWIEQHPNPQLTLAINTNLCPPDDLWQNFLTQIERISAHNKVKHIDLFTSIEAWGEQAEYIRYGMDFNLWRARMWQVLSDLPKVHMTIMATYNALSVTTFDVLLCELLKIKQTESFYSQDRQIPVYIDVAYLRYPEHQALKVLTPDFIEIVYKHYEFMKAHAEVSFSPQGGSRRGFMPFEIEKMLRTASWFANISDELDEPTRKRVLRQDFFRFFSEHDRRRQTQFLHTFPELTGFWYMCKDLARESRRECVQLERQTQ